MPKEPLLPTKLFIPRLRTPLVERLPLIERLDQALGRKLALLCAPGGFGKTALLSQWLSHMGEHMRAGWISLAETENDPDTFWLYIAAALDRVSPGLGSDLETAVRSRAGAGTLWRACVYGAATAPHDFVLVLDDYQVITRPEIHQGVGALLEHLPPQMHLVISSRTDPPLSLARLRAADELVELRAQDLRFSADEVRAMLREIRGLSLRPDQLERLGERTEGWPAGLQMAALAMQGRPDLDRFIQDFAGSHRFIMDYLGEEVIERQPTQVQRFLLHTAMLERLTGPLCDLVTGESGGQSMLHLLEQENLFITQLDEQREWYRYHQLFADVLCVRLRQQEPDLEPVLHLRASHWFESVGQMADSIRHALAAGDTSRAADLVEQAVESTLGQGEMRTVQTWLESLPTDVLLGRPYLALAYAERLVDNGQLEQAGPLLERTEALAQTLFAHAESRRSSVQGKVAALRGFGEIMKHNLGAGIDLCETALGLLPEQELHWHGKVTLALAGAHHLRGALAPAAEAYARAAALSHLAGDLHSEVVTICSQAKMLIEQGQTDQAEQTLRQALRLCTGTSHQTLAASCWAHLYLANLLRGRQRLEEAEFHAVEGIRAAVAGGQVEARIDGYVTLALLVHARGESDRAHELIQEAMEVAPPEIGWVRRVIQAVRVHLWLRESNLEPAAEWAQEHGEQIGDDLFSPQSVELATLMRVYIATGQLQPLLERLERLLPIILTAGSPTMEQEWRLYGAIAYHLAGDESRSLVELERVLAGVEQNGLVGTALEMGPWLAPLLRKALGASSRPKPITELLQRMEPPPPAPSARVTPGRALHPLLEPLTERELEVLRLMAEGASNQEIADRLFVALTTVKKHAGNIFGKLGASNRVHAIARARELALL